MSRSKVTDKHIKHAFAQSGNTKRVHGTFIDIFGLPVTEEVKEVTEEVKEVPKKEIKEVKEVPKEVKDSLDKHGFGFVFSKKPKKTQEKKEIRKELRTSLVANGFGFIVVPK